MFFETRDLTPRDKAGPVLAYAFAAMQFTGAIGLLAIVATVLFSRGVKRSLPWMSFFFGWILACLSYDLLLFAGQQTGAYPNHALCLMQSSLIHTAPILQSATNLALIVHTWSYTWYLISHWEFMSKRASLISLLVLPWFFSFFMFTGFLVFGITHPGSIRRDGPGFYCSIVSHRVASAVTAGVSGFLMIPAIIIKFSLGITMYRNWRLLSEHPIHLSSAIRVMVIITAGALVLGILIIYLVSNPGGSQSDFVLASIPIVAVLVFGTSKDLLRVWFRRKPEPSNDTERYLPKDDSPQPGA